MQKKQLFSTVIFVLKWEKNQKCCQKENQIDSNFFKKGFPSKFTEDYKKFISAQTGNLTVFVRI